MIQSRSLKIAYITPTYFDPTSALGGGERYPTALAGRISKFAETKLVSFGAERKSYYQNELKIEIYPVKKFIHENKLNPVNFRYLETLLWANIVHIHQINTLISDLGAIASRILKKRVLVTDHGGGGSLVLNQKLPVFACYDHAIAQSIFAIKTLPPPLQSKVVPIRGGVDTEKFAPNVMVKRSQKILYVGRILPHKGINYLIEAFKQLNQPNWTLTIAGRIHHEQFYQDLKQLAQGFPVEFIHDADDQQLLQKYQSAWVVVLPSVCRDCYGNYTPIPELMGLTLLEAQACGTPVICTNAGAMAEFVNPGKTGLVVEQNSAEDLANALQHFLSLSAPEHYIYQQQCRDWIEAFSWSTVVKQHLQLYQKVANLT